MGEVVLRLSENPQKRNSNLRKRVLVNHMNRQADKHTKERLRSRSELSQGRLERQLI